MRRSSVAVPLLALVTLGGCATAPKYVRPEIDTGEAYRELGPWQPAGAGVPPAGRWWELFGDPVLSGLQERLEAGSPDLAAAAARYAEALAVVGRERGETLPQVDAAATAGMSRLSGGRPLGSGEPASYSEYLVGASLSYELDLFGRVRNSVRASEARAEAAHFDVGAVRLGLQAQLADVYFSLRGLDARAALLQETVAAYQRAYDLTAIRRSGGIASGIDVSQAQSQLASARAELDAVVAERARDEHALAVLLGAVPSRFAVEASAEELAPPQIPAALPSALLERRPDVAAAERRVAAANAQIGVARAALFPAVTLGAAAGFQSTRGALLDVANGFWALGPLAAVMRIFDNGARKAGVRITQAQYDEAVAGYRETVLTAFREVEDDLATARQLALQESDQREAAASAARARDLALIRYRDGASDYLEVVAAQAVALNAQRSLLDVHSQQLRLATDLVRALGGVFEPAPAATPPGGLTGR
jgi:multidrug efflux system outer membrane protein